MYVPHDAFFQNCINGSTPPNRRTTRAQDKYFKQHLEYWPKFKIILQLLLIIPSTKMKPVDGAQRCRTRISKGDFGTLKYGYKGASSTNFMPDDLLEVICILERGKKHNSYKIIRKRNYFSLITKFPAKNRRH